MANLAIKTVKNMDATMWQRGIDAANARGDNFGTWLARAIEAHIATQAGDRLIFPGDHQADLPPVPVASWDTADRLFAGLGQIADGKGNRDVARQVRQALAMQVEALTGVPARQTKAPNRADQAIAIPAMGND